MRPWLVFRRIMLPQMLSFAIPGINNNWLGLMKASALVSILGLEDMVWLAEQAGRATQKPFCSTSGLADLYGHHRLVQLAV